MKPICYPLTPAQKVHQLALKEYGTPQVLNLGVCLTIRQNLDFGLLKKCIQMEFDRYECLRVRFTRPDENGEIQQYIAPHDSRDIPFINLDDKSKEEIDTIMTGWSAIPFTEPDEPLNKFIMIALPEGYQGIYLCIDHRIIDSCGIIVMINDIMELYCHYIFRTPLPQPLASYREALERDFTKAADPKRLAKAAAFWEEQAALGEPIYTDPTGPWKLEESRRRHGNPALRAADREMKDMRGDRAIFHLEPEATGRLMDFCLDNNISMTNLLLMGMRTYLSKMNNSEPDISIRNYVSRRSGRHNRTSGGNRIHCYPCRTIMEPDTEFLNGVYIIQNLQNNIYRHTNYDQAAVFKLYADAYPRPENTTYESMALTYQPLPTRLQNESLRGISYKNEWYPNGTAVQKLYLTVMHSSADLGLEFYFKYQKAELTKDDIERIYYYLMKIIFMGVENPEITIGEILRTV